MLPFFDKFQTHSKVKSLTLILFSLSLFSFIILPSNVSAHAYSASYTTITMDNNKTELVFSMDTLSILELIKGIDKNKNWELEKSEVENNKSELEEVVSEGLALDKGNSEQTPKFEKMKLVKKQNKTFLSFYMSYPSFSPGETVTLNDGFYANDTATNYVNLISASYEGERSEGVIQGKERVWTMLLTEIQQDQGASNSQSVTQDQNQPEKIQNNSLNKPPTTTWLSFLKLGMMHILSGYDHLLFLFALLIGKQTIKQYITTITAFTIAHSITLTLAVLGIVDLPSRFVESMIALSICYVAVENIFRKEIKYRWVITFFFGLIHGLGFASLLKEMNLPKSDLAIALLNFNVGIEIIQLLIVLLLVPVLFKLQKLINYKSYMRAGSVGIFLLGAICLFQRLFA